MSLLNQVTIQAEAGVTYYFQLGSLYDYNNYVGLTLSVTPPPQASFYYSPWEPSIYDLTWFYDNSYDLWPNRSAGKRAVGSLAMAQAARTYRRPRINLPKMVTIRLHTPSPRLMGGQDRRPVWCRSARVTSILPDARPSSATAGQTKKLGITLTDKRYPQNVRVDFYKSVPGGYYQIGYTEQYAAANRKTDFYLSYTFTPADAQIGKVTVKAVATILDGRDALPADNEFISLPITVKGRSGRSAEYCRRRGQPRYG